MSTRPDDRLLRPCSRRSGPTTVPSDRLRSASAQSTGSPGQHLGGVVHLRAAGPGLSRRLPAIEVLVTARRLINLDAIVMAASLALIFAIIAGVL